MAQLIVRKVEDGVKERLRRRARRNGRSMEEEVREILRSVVHEEDALLTTGLGTEISSLFTKTGIDFDIPELHGHEIKPLKFES
jgi:plasmid stability protein